MENYKTLKKTVRVGDPWRWYNRDTVDVFLWVHPLVLDRQNVEVSIVVSSIDDFSASRGIICDKKYPQSIEAFYNHLKKYMFDAMPEEITVDWLYEHGYLPNGEGEH